MVKEKDKRNRPKVWSSLVETASSPEITALGLPWEPWARHVQGPGLCTVRFLVTHILATTTQREGTDLTGRVPQPVYAANELQRISATPSLPTSLPALDSSSAESSVPPSALRQRQPLAAGAIPPAKVATRPLRYPRRTVIASLNVRALCRRGSPDQAKLHQLIQWSQELGISILLLQEVRGCDCPMVKLPDGSSKPERAVGSAVLDGWHFRIALHTYSDKTCM